MAYPRTALRRRPAPALVGALTLSLGFAWLPAQAALAHDRSSPPGSSTPSVVASGLDNPRGLALDSHGRLVVGEAGHAGPICTAAPGELGPTCVGFTSRISRISTKTGDRSTLVDGLPSIGTAVGPTGVDGVAVRHNKVYGIITGSPQGVPAGACGTGASPGCADAVAQAKTKLGDLIRVDGHRARSVAEVGLFDYQWIVDNKARLGVTANPDFQPGDSNPYGVAAGPDGGFYVVDAGSNTLDWVSRHGQVRVLTYLPDPPGPADQRFPYDAVPTCVVPTGHSVWIGTLSGQVYRWDGHDATLVADRSDGLTAINGCGADRHGNLYVSNIFGLPPAGIFAPHTGFVSKVTKAGDVSTVAGTQGLSFPAGIAISGHTLFVAVQSICPSDLSLVGPADPPVCDATGQVLSVRI
jgi:hypothetical protein